MPITFIKKRKSQQYLILILAGLILIIFSVVLFGFLAREETFSPQSFKPPAAKVNIKILEDPIFEYLQPFKQIPSFNGEIGRKNPFLPY